ncbi:hypothetical protein, partial [Gemmatimonas sp.]|uniref:hypothetical protein n=1 Tax=Gemmatimonas sp. TaxID=1962908 RepID=UPI00286D4662
MQGSTFRSAALAVASLGLLAACDRGDTLTAPAGQLSSKASLALEVSDVAAASGTRVTVSLANRSLTALGGVQGRLRFNPSQLRYVGQLRDAGSDQIMLVNARAANAGELTVAVVEASGIDHSQPLVFDVVSSAYATSLSFEPTDAVLNGTSVTQTTVTVDDAIQLNAALATSGDAERLTVTDWLEVTAQKPEPGEIRAGLKFGDTNFDGALSLNDALYVINVSVGANEMIIGTDGTGGTGDRDAVVAGNVFPANGPGLGEVGDALPPGVEANGTRVLSLGDGLAIINESVGNNQDVVGEVIPGRPLVAVSNRIVVTGNISTNTTWTKSNIYELVDEVIVTGGATLTIEAGTLVEGRQGTFAGGVSSDGSALYIARDGKIQAVGTPLEPIVFTCVGTKFKGCWGGISILGNASNNRGTADSPIVAGRSATGGCVQTTSEGRTTKLYGGCNDDDNSGVLQYARIEYAGFRFTPTNELNGLALYGVGRGTTLDHIQVHAGLDDGIEFFGGTVNAKYIYLTANSDDSFDYTESYTGNAQFVIVQHDSLDSDKGLEMDNNTATPDALPRSTPKLYNFTVVGKQFTASTSGAAGNNSVGGLHVRVGAQPKMFNFIVQNFPFAIDIDNNETCTGFNTASGMQIGNSLFTQNTRVDASDTGDPAACGLTEVEALNAAGTNEFLATSPVLSPFSVTVPDFRPAFGTATGGIAPPA